MNKHRAIIFTIAALAAVPASATPSVSSSAYGVKADLRIGGNLVAAVAATPVASGTAPAAYDRSGTLVGIDQSAKLVDGLVLDLQQSLSSGLITARANSAWPATLAGSADVGIAGVSGRVGTELLALGQIVRTLGFGFDATALGSTTGVGLDAAGRLVATHDARLTGLRFTSDLLDIASANLLAGATIGPNSAIRLGAIDILLNEQREVRTGTSDLLAWTNALRITFNDYALGGSLLSGEIVIGHSEAAIRGFDAAAVPEPATWAMLILGFGLVGAVLRGRRPSGAVTA